MVEKVFISPNRVRAYGNIINMKTGDDFTLVNSELTVTTDMVDGAEMTVFSMECEPHISLTATNPYMLSGETTDIVAKLKKCLYKPLANKNVTIEQSVFRDDGTTVRHNDNWTLTSNMQRTRNDSYTTLSNVGGTSQMAYPINDTTKFSGDITIEWENYATTYQLDYLIISGTSDTAKAFGALGITKPCKVRITIRGTTCTSYIDGVEKYSYTFNRDANNQFKVRLQINPGGNDIKYKDFKIYEIINGVTDENGEFALQDVSVTDDTTFNASYETLSDTCTVEKCLFVDYGVTGKSNLTNMYYQGETTVTDTGTLFEPNSSNRWTIRPNAFGLFNTPIVIEFTIVSTSHRFIMQGFDSNTTQVFSIDTSTNMQDGDFVRIEIGSTEAKFYRNGSQMGDSWTYSSTSSMKFQLFFNQANTYLEYKDFRIREG